MSQIYFITGASSGLGYALAQYTLEQGDRVVLTGLDLPPMHELAARYPDSALALPLDVTDPEQREAAVGKAEAQFGAIDVLVNNAGIDFLGAVEEQDERDYRKLFEVNFFSAVALTRLVLSGMRSRRRGTVVNISSMDGIAGLPVNGYYSASKFALEGLTEALAAEIAPLGLRAFSVEPGSVRTGIEKRTSFSGTMIDDYQATSGAFRELVGSMTPEMFPGDPVRVAAAIHAEVAAGTGRKWLILGSDAHRIIGAKLEALRAEHAGGEAVAASTDFPGSGPAVL